MYLISLSRGIDECVGLQLLNVNFNNKLTILNILHYKILFFLLTLSRGQNVLPSVAKMSSGGNFMAKMSGYPSKGNQHLIWCNTSSITLLTVKPLDSNHRSLTKLSQSVKLLTVGQTSYLDKSEWSGAFSIFFHINLYEMFTRLRLASLFAFIPFSSTKIYVQCLQDIKASIILLLLFFMKAAMLHFVELC